MSDAWDEVLDWERWAREVLTDWRVPFDNHKVGLRIGITQHMRDQADEIVVLKNRLSGMEDLYIQACEQRDDALAAGPRLEPKRCAATLGNAGQCVKESGHDGQHTLVDVTRPDDRWRATDTSNLGQP